MSEAIDRMSTTEDVRDAYIESAFEGYEQEAAEAFDRWLAAHEDAIRTVALEEAAQIAETPRPYGYTAATAIRALNA